MSRCRWWPSCNLHPLPPVISCINYLSHQHQHSHKHGQYFRQLVLLVPEKSQLTKKLRQNLSVFFRTSSLFNVSSVENPWESILSCDPEVDILQFLETFLPVGDLTHHYIQTIPSKKLPVSELQCLTTIEISTIWVERNLICRIWEPSPLLFLTQDYPTAVVMHSIISRYAPPPH